MTNNAPDYQAADRLVFALTRKAIKDEEWPRVKQLTIYEQQAATLATHYPITLAMLRRIFNVIEG